MIMAKTGMENAENIHVKATSNIDNLKLSEKISTHKQKGGMAMKVTKMMLILVAVFGVFIFASRQGYSAPIIYTGMDLEYTSGNASAAAASFDAAVGSFSSITFEGLPVGSYSSFTAVPGVNVTYSGVYWTSITQGTETYYSGVNNVLVNESWGYNTTAGGSYYLGMYPQPTGTEHTVSITFSFDQPINAFGAYFSGLEWFTTPSPITLNYSTDDGTYNLEIVKPTQADDSLGLRFFGITDINSISQITLTEVVPGTGNYDAWGLDDVRYASSSAAPVPEPATMLLLGSGLIGLAGFRRKFKK